MCLEDAVVDIAGGLDHQLEPASAAQSVHRGGAEDVDASLRNLLSKPAAQEQVQGLLAGLELEPWADSTPGAIGRNWQKRVGLARALALNPELLLIDNPLLGLDLRHINWWLGFLEQLSRGHKLLQNRPVTLVITTADLRPWKGRARQFAILNERKLAVLGTWEQLESASEELLREVYETKVAT